MLGYGTALKILFVKSPQNLILERNEVVALINTAARLSENLVEVRELTTMYWEQERAKIANLETATEAGRASSVESRSTWTTTSYDSLDILDMTIGVISEAGRKELISIERERELINLALGRPNYFLVVQAVLHLRGF